MIPTGLATFVLNLKRREDRKENMVRFCQQAGLKTVTFVEAVDGSELLRKKHGRVELLRPKIRLHKMTWTGPDKLRVSQLQRLPPKKDARKGFNLWSFLGCNLSHALAWDMVMKQGHGMALIMEDDCHFVGDAKKFGSQLRAGIQGLQAHYPNWCLCYLGGFPLNRPGKPGVKPCVVPGLSKASCVYQAHAYLIRPDAKFLESLKAKMTGKGLSSANAMVSWTQSAEGRGRAFFFDQPQLVQQGNLGSDLLMLSPDLGGERGWTLNRKRLRDGEAPNLTKGQLKLAGPKGRGTKPIPKKVLVKTMRKRASDGGKARAGNGSSQKTISRKESWLKKFFAEKDVFPTFRQAWDLKRVSRSVYNRVRAEVCIVGFGQSALESDSS